MFIEKFSNNGIEYLRLVKSQRFTRSDGVRTVRKHIIYNIGPLSRFDDGQPDYVDRLKKSFKNGNPIIPQLQPFCEVQPPRKTYDLELIEGDPQCIGHPKIYSHCLLEKILEELGLTSFVTRYKKKTNYQFDVLGFFRLLVFGRILNPASKIASVRQNDDYYQPILKDPYVYNAYDTLDFVYRYRKQIISRINSAMQKSFHRATDIIYYDVTNFYCEIEYPDEDDVDKEGNIIQKGLRKKGVSKENRNLPIVQMGLFMDEQGYPMAIESFPGNTLDHLTVCDALKDTIDNLDLPRFIFVGDRGMYRGTNTYHLIESNNGYIVSKSLAKTQKEERDWMLDKEGYTHLGDAFKYKSRIISRRIKTEAGTKKDITEKVVVYWSKSFYDKQIHENASFLEVLERIKKDPANFRVTKSSTKKLSKFFKKEYTNTDTGEIIDGKNLETMIDEDKVNAYKELFGYYQIVTSELDKPDQEIIDIYRGLTRIEDQFEIMKGTLTTRPLRVWTPEHIEAHLLICMIALILVRIIQNRIVDYKGKNPEKNWEEGLSGKRIQNALNKWTVEILTNDYWRFNNIDDPDLKLILDAFDIKIPIKLYKLSDLKHLKTCIKIIK